MSARQAIQSLSSLRHVQLQQSVRGMRLAALRAKRLSDSVRPPASPKIKSGNPKRDPTTYGIPRTANGAGVPVRPQEVDELPAYANHPLWSFFHDRQSVEVGDLSKDFAGEQHHICFKNCLRKGSMLNCVLLCRSLLESSRVAHQII